MRGEKKKKGKEETLDAQQSYEYNITNTIKKYFDERNLIKLRKITNDDQSMLHLLLRDDG
jgi:ribosomal protein S18